MPMTTCDQPHAGSAVISGCAAVGSTASGWTNNGDGTWTAQITLGSTAGELEVMPKLNGQDAAANAAKVTVVLMRYLQTSRKSLSQKIT